MGREGARRAGGGERVKLQAWRIGGRWLTTPECVERFLEQTSSTNIDAKNAKNPQIRTVAQRNRASEEAGQKLAAMGL